MRNNGFRVSSQGSYHGRSIVQLIQERKSACTYVWLCVEDTRAHSVSLLPSRFTPALLPLTLLPFHTHVFPAGLFQMSSLVLGYLQQSAFPEQ